MQPISIDFGTSSTRIATFHNGTISLIDDNQGKYYSPSISQKHFGPTYNVKYLLSPLSEFKEEDVKTITRNQNIPNKPDLLQLIADVLEFPLQTKKFENPIDHIMASVPSYYGVEERNMIKKALEQNKIHDVTFINESTAAVLYYQQRKQMKPEDKDGIYFVVDFSSWGVTLSCVKVLDSAFITLGTVVIKDYGGDAFDQCLLEEMIKNDDTIKEWLTIDDIRKKKEISGFNYGEISLYSLWL